MTPNSNVITFQSQRGKQTDFMESDADIVIYGGAAGGGKTFGIILCPTYFFHLDGVNGAIFRREFTDLVKPGAIWGEAKKVYNQLGFKENNARMQYQFKPNSYLKFSGLQYDNSVYSWQGAQLDFLAFDELTHFSSFQFWYLVARMRSVSGKIKPYCRASCNPEPGWVYDLLKWWIDDAGFPIPERSGVIRWFYRIGDEMRWFDSEEEARIDIKRHDLKLHQPLSLTFIPATLNDNQILLKNNPGYYAALSQLPEDERSKLLDGCWLYRPQGKLFKARDFNHFVINPRDVDFRIVTVDTAASEKTSADYTVMQIWSRSENRIFLESQTRGRFDYNTQLNLLLNICNTQNIQYIILEEASTGVVLTQHMRNKVTIPMLTIKRTKSKYNRGYLTQGYVESGYVYLNPGADYFNDFISEISAFSPENKNKYNVHDDQVDCMMDAIEQLLINKIGQRNHVTSELQSVQRATIKNV